MENINEAPFQAFLRDMLHPVRGRLLIALLTHKEATAGELAKALPDIPQATLYRHLGAMVEEGTLKVVQERKKRAMYERVYAAALDFTADIEAMIQQNRGDVYAALFFQYMTVFLQEFQAYALRPGIDIARDGSGFSMSPVYATDEELQSVLMQVSQLLETLRCNTPGEGRKTHTIGLIITPPKADET